MCLAPCMPHTKLSHMLIGFIGGLQGAKHTFSYPLSFLMFFAFYFHVSVTDFTSFHPYLDVSSSAALSVIAVLEQVYLQNI